MPEPRSPKPYRTYRSRRTARNDPDAARFDALRQAGSGAQSRERTPAGMAAPPMVRQPAAPPRQPLPGRTVGTVPPRGEPPRTAPPRRRRIGWRRGILLGLLVIVVVLAAWIGLAYREFSQEVEKANARVDRATMRALTPADNILFNPHISLVLGSDARSEDSASRADSILLARTDPDAHMISLLSIPRDLLVPVPGVGDAKINSAYAVGGPPLLIRTVNRLTGFRVNHIVLIDFTGFRDLVDALGGVDIRNPTPVHSSEPFDGVIWHFEKGDIHLSGRRALAYARIRKTTNPADSDVSRTERQQRVTQAIARDLASPTNIFRLPKIGRAVAQPLATDLSANQLLGMGWIKFRSERTLECHLGGTPQLVNGEAVLVSSEQNRAVVDMFLGRSAPQPPPRGEPFAPGCTVR